MLALALGKLGRVCSLRGVPCVPEQIHHGFTEATLLAPKYFICLGCKKNMLVKL